MSRSRPAPEETVAPKSVPIAPETGHRSASDRTLPYVLAVFLLPLLVLWHRADALFSPLWYADPWFYLGYFRDLVNYKRDLFFGSYYGSRLAWVLPGFLIHSVFSPVIANLVLHVTVHLTATLSFFAVLRRLAGLRAAFLATMVFSVDPWLWAATGWDYPDGAGIAYCLLAMALLTRSAAQSLRPWSLLLAGIAIAGMAYTHLFLGTFTLLLVLYYFGLVWVRHGSLALRPAILACLCIGAGAAIATLGLCGVNYLLDGTFWFYAPSVNRAFRMAGDFQFVRSIWRTRELVPWLWPAVFGSCTALLLLAPRWKRKADPPNGAALVLSAPLLLAFAYMGYLQSRGTTVLGHHPYVSYLLPFGFLVMGSSFWPAVESMPLRTYVLICSAAALAFGALWHNPNGYAVLTSAAASQAAIAVSAFILTIALALRYRTAGAILGIAGFGVFTAAALSQTYLTVGTNLHSTRREYARVMQARQRIEDRRAGAPILFWYDRQESSSFFQYVALNATYIAEFERINETFPRGCSGPAEPGTLVVITSEKERSSELAQAALTDCWLPFGVHPVFESQEVINGDPRPYTMTMLRVEPTAATLPPPGEVFKSVPLEQVKLATNHAVLRRTSQGLEVQTIRGFGAYAGSLKLGLDPGTREKFAVLVRLRVLEGKIAVGILDPSGKRFLINTPVWPLPRAIDLVVPVPSPPVIGDLIISNVRPNAEASKAVIEKIEIRKLP